MVGGGAEGIRYLIIHIYIFPKDSCTESIVQVQPICFYKYRRRNMEIKQKKKFCFCHISIRPTRMPPLIFLSLPRQQHLGHHIFHHLHHHHHQQQQKQQQEVVTNGVFCLVGYSWVIPKSTKAFVNNA